MNRRKFNTLSTVTAGMLIWAASRHAWALSINDLSNSEATRGLKLALEKSAIAAVSLLGKTDGFLGNEKVRIVLPGYLEDASKWLKTLGQGERLDALVTAMNRAAEAAVPMGRDMLVSAVKSMNVDDAKNILAGGDTSVTRFFAEKTRAALGVKFLPVVTRATGKVGLAQKYNDVAGKVASLGLMKREDANIEQHVTAKTLDGLYYVIGEEEKKIRQDPIGTGSAILQKVFGALK